MQHQRGEICHIDLPAKPAESVNRLSFRAQWRSRTLEHGDNCGHNKMHIFFSTGAEDQKSMQDPDRRFTFLIIIFLDDTKQKRQQTSKIPLEFALQRL